MSSREHLKWQSGGRAWVLSLEGEVVQVLSESPFAPGSRPSGQLLRGPEFRMKTHRCQKQDDGRFVLSGRVIDLTRSLKPYVLELVRPQTSEESTDGGPSETLPLGDPTAANDSQAPT